MDLFRRISRKALLVRAFGVFILIIGFLIQIFHPYMIIRKYFGIIREEGLIFNAWHTSGDVNILVKAYAFNITNKDAFLAGKEKLRLEEVGPFIYKETMDQENIKFDHDEGVIISQPRYRLEWVSHLNKFTEDTLLVVPSMGKMYAADFADNFRVGSYNFVLGFTNFFTGTELIENCTWKQFAFDGSAGVSQLMKLGIFTRIWEHSEDFSVTYSGEKNYAKAGLLKSYNGLDYDLSKCNKVNGSTNGFKLGNNLSNETIYFHRKGLCRTIPFVPIEETRYGSWVKYKIAENAFDYNTNPKSECFCTSQKCLPKGLSILAPCYQGFPVALSLPHFLEADPSLSKNIEGLKPRADLHESYLIVNQDLGIVKEISVKFQINLLVNKVENEYFSEMITPLMWLEISMPSLPFIKRCQTLVIGNLFAIETIICIGFLILGCYLIFCRKFEYLNKRRISGFEDKKKLFRPH